MKRGHGRARLRVIRNWRRRTVSANDEQMLVALADENARREIPIEAKIDTVLLVQKHLRAHPEACKHHSSAERTNEKSARVDGRGGKTHDHGGITCIAEFLGEKNWGRTVIGELFELHGTVPRPARRNVTRIRNPNGQRVQEFNREFNPSQA